MDTVALASVVGGAVVGLAGVVATGANAWRERETRKEEGAATRAHERELAGQANVHERELARQARLWDDRKRAYVELLNHLLDLMEAVEETHPMIVVAPAGGQQQVDEQPAPDPDMRPRLRAMEAAVTAFGSADIGSLTRDFMQKARMFSLDVGTYRQVRAAAGPGQQTAQALDRLNATRQELRDLYTQLADRIRVELTQEG